jgi:hypothetical protein
VDIRIAKAKRHELMALLSDPLPQASGGTAARKVYVGRPSPLGNPWPLGRDGSREQVIARYRRWLWQRLQQADSPQRKALEELLEHVRRQPLVLLCWCHPLPCHGEVIRNALLWMAAQQGSSSRP